MKHEVEASWVANDDGAAVFRFRPDLEVFAGHFPNHALVPGVYLIEAVRVTAERELDRPLRLAAVDNARFTAEVLPDVEVRCTVRLTEGEGSWTCDAKLEAGGESAARIRLTLAAQ